MTKSPHIPDDLTMLPRTAAEAVRVGALYYFTGEPCKYGHISAWRAKNHTCQQCANESSKRWNAKVSEAKELQAFLAEGLAVAATHDLIESIGIDAVRAQEEAERLAAEEAKREAARAQIRQWRDNQMEEEGTEAYRMRIAAEGKAKYWANPEKQRERIRKRHRAGTSGYRMIRLRTPPWLTDAEHDKNDAFYASRLLGEEVDHIVPIDDHPDIAGLHVPWNLQILPRAKNAQRVKGRVNEFRCTPEEAADYVARGMAVRKKDIAEDGVIDWSRYPRPEAL